MSDVLASEDARPLGVSAELSHDRVFLDGKAAAPSTGFDPISEFGRSILGITSTS